MSGLSGAAPAPWVVAGSVWIDGGIFRPRRLGSALGAHAPAARSQEFWRTLGAHNRGTPGRHSGHALQAGTPGRHSANALRAGTPDRHSGHARSGRACMAGTRGHPSGACNWGTHLGYALRAHTRATHIRPRSAVARQDAASELVLQHEAPSRFSRVCATIACPERVPISPPAVHSLGLLRVEPDHSGVELGQTCVDFRQLWHGSTKLGSKGRTLAYFRITLARNGPCCGVWTWGGVNISSLYVGLAFGTCGCAHFSLCGALRVERPSDTARQQVFKFKPFDAPLGISSVEYYESEEMYPAPNPAIAAYSLTMFGMRAIQFDVDIGDDVSCLSEGGDVKMDDQVERAENRPCHGETHPNTVRCQDIKTLL